MKGPVVTPPHLRRVGVTLQCVLRWVLAALAGALRSRFLMEARTRRLQGASRS